MITLIAAAGAVSLQHVGKTLGIHAVKWPALMLVVVAGLLAARSPSVAQDDPPAVPLSSDAAAFDDLFRLIEERVENGTYVWVIEAKVDIARTTTFSVEFQDGSDEAVDERPISFSPTLFGISAGDRSRGEVALLSEEQMADVRRLVVKSGEKL